MKPCTDRGVRKPLTAFMRQARLASGYGSRCKACGVTREIARQKARRAAGRCPCGQALYSRYYCLRHLQAARRRERRRGGHRPYYVAGTGRPPLERRPA